jgi:hypothetical protein
MAAGGEGDTKVYGLHPRHRGGAPRMDSVRHLAARERPAGRTTPYSDEGLRQTRLRFRKGARILFVLLFTTVFGPIVLVALIAFAAYGFFSSRRGR